MKKATQKTCKYCGGKYYARDMCKIHYVRQQKGYSLDIPLKVQKNRYETEGETTIVTYYDKNHLPKGTFMISTNDIELVKAHKWSETSNGYIAAYFDNKIVLLHRFLTKCPDGFVVDHINHNRKDNRRCNLRVCTQKENCENTEHPLGKSGVRHIIWDNGLWKVKFKGKFIGSSKNLDKAKQILGDNL